MQTRIIIKTQFEAFHYWKEAPEEVKFLRNPHRHLFQVEVQIPTTEDRELEFFIVKKKLDTMIALYWKDKEFSYSCEILAEKIKKEVDLLYKTCCLVKIFEDGENGAIVYPT